MLKRSELELYSEVLDGSYWSTPLSSRRNLKRSQSTPPVFEISPKRNRYESKTRNSSQDLSVFKLEDEIKVDLQLSAPILTSIIENEPYQFEPLIESISIKSNLSNTDQIENEDTISIILNEENQQLMNKSISIKDNQIISTSNPNIESIEERKDPIETKLFERNEQNQSIPIQTSKRKHKSINLLDGDYWTSPTTRRQSSRLQSISISKESASISNSIKQSSDLLEDSLIFDQSIDSIPKETQQEVVNSPFINSISQEQSTIELISESMKLIHLNESLNGIELPKKLPKKSKNRTIDQLDGSYWALTSTSRSPIKKSSLFTSEQVTVVSKPKKKSKDKTQLTKSTTKKKRKSSNTYSKFHLFLDNSFSGKSIKSKESQIDFERRHREAIEIIQDIFIGNQLIASDLNQLQQQQIQSILNVSREIQNYFTDQIDYLHLPIEDEQDFRLVDLFFDQGVDFIQNSLISGKKVLVHCQKGRSRSPCFVLACLFLCLFQILFQIKLI